VPLFIWPKTNMFLIKTTLNHHLTHLWYKYTWLRHSLTLANARRLGLRLMAGYILVVAVQFIYPSHLVLPQTRIGGEYYGFQSVNGIARQINEFNNKSLAIQAGEHKLTMQPAELGVTINGQATAKLASNYNWRQKFIPFSLLGRDNTVRTYALQVNEQKLMSFATDLSRFNIAPTDANLTLNGTQTVITPAADGHTFRAESVVAKLKETGIDSSFAVTFSPVTVPATIPTAAAVALETTIQTRLAAPLSITAAGKQLDISAETVASWMSITQDPGKQTLTLAYDRAKIKTALQTFSSRIYIADADNRITMVDGEATASQSGASGQALNMETTIDAVIAATTTNETAVNGVVQAVAPGTQINRTYTRSSKGLQALVSYWAQTHGGTYGIMLRSTDGAITAELNADKQFTSASTYKLYVAYFIYKKVEAGTLSLNDTTSTGNTVAGCIDKMIRLSDNECAIALGYIIGWSANDPALHALGLTSTTLSSGAHLTTARDAATYMWAFQNGSLLSAGYLSALKAVMSEQIYRRGIPAGSLGTVYDKVGFLGSLNHDVALVEHPKGSYVLTIYSSGSSFDTISTLAKAISNVMNQ
jgi:beta-lactamase class A